MLKWTKCRWKLVMTSLTVATLSLWRKSYVVSRCLRRIDAYQFHDMTTRCHFNTLKPEQNGRLLAGEIFRRITLDENCSVIIRSSLKIVTEGSNETLVQLMGWRRFGESQFSEPMLIKTPTPHGVTRALWVFGRFDKPAIDIHRWFYDP